MSSIAADKFGCFGKLPVSREFLVERSAELSRSGFDSWVSEGMALARGPLGATFKEHATHFPPYQFVWSGRDKNAAGLVGELIPGMDAAGRIHPFSIFAVLEPDSIRSAHPTEPFRLSGLHGSITAAVHEARATRDPAALTARVREVRAALPDAQYESSEYQSYLESRTTGDFWSALWGDARDPGRYQILQALYETVEYLRGRSSSEVRMGIRFPLPERTGLLAIGFWIDLVARIFRAPLDGCSYFWTNGSAEPKPIAPAAGDGAAQNEWSPHLLFFFSAPTIAQFVALIDPRSDVESISYLERPYGGAPEERMNEALRTILDDPDAPLRAILDWADRS